MHPIGRANRGISYTQRLNTLNLVSGRLVSSEQMRRPGGAAVRSYSLY